MHHFRHKKHQVGEQKKERKKSTRQKRMSVLFGSVYKCFVCVIGYKKKKKGQKQKFEFGFIFKNLIWREDHCAAAMKWNLPKQLITQPYFHMGYVQNFYSNLCSFCFF